MSAKQVSELKEQAKNSRGIWETLKRFSKKALLVFVVFVVSIIALAFLTTRGVSDTANGYIDQLRAGECGTLYEQTSTLFREATSDVEWMDYCGEVSVVLTGNVTQKGVEIEASTGGPKVGVARYEILGNDGATYDVFVELLDQDGWKLNTFAFQVVETTEEADS